MTGYTLDQLLEWCVGDKLIEGYEREGDRVVLFHAGRRMEMTPGKARTFLAQTLGRSVPPAFGKGNGAPPPES